MRALYFSLYHFPFDTYHPWCSAYHLYRTKLRFLYFRSSYKRYCDETSKLGKTFYITGWMFYFTALILEYLDGSRLLCDLSPLRWKLKCLLLTSLAFDRSSSLLLNLILPIFDRSRSPKWFLHFMAALIISFFPVIKREIELLLCSSYSMGSLLKFLTINFSLVLIFSRGFVHPLEETWQDW